MGYHELPRLEKSKGNEFFQVGRSPVMTIKSQVLALKYRPQTFKDLIGHEEIATKFIILLKIIIQLMLFCLLALRIGKTTFARIVAKALNCEKAIEGMCEKMQSLRSNIEF